MPTTNIAGDFLNLRRIIKNKLNYKIFLNKITFPFNLLPIVAKKQSESHNNPDDTTPFTPKIILFVYLLTAV